MTTITCPNCNYEYTPRKLAGKCPRCQRKLPVEMLLSIDLDLKPCHCHRCGHDWQTNSKRVPRGCPICKSKFWFLPHKPQWHANGPFYHYHGGFFHTWLWSPKEGKHIDIGFSKASELHERMRWNGKKLKMIPKIELQNEGINILK